MVNLNDLTAEQRAKLQQQMEEERKQEQERIKADREAYKKLVDEMVVKQFRELEAISESLLTSKTKVFESFDSIIELKDDLYNTKSDRQSDTFSTSDGAISIQLGNRMNEGWDDTVDVGIMKVKEFLKTLARDENSAVLVETVLGLLSRDRKGNLKANRVLELEKLADRSDNKDFIEGIEIIKAAYRPEPTCQFISVRYKDAQGKYQSLPLSMSAMEVGTSSSEDEAENETENEK